MPSLFGYAPTAHSQAQIACPPLGTGPVEQLGIVQAASAVLLGGENIDMPKPKAVADSARDVDVHV